MALDTRDYMQVRRPKRKPANDWSAWIISVLAFAALVAFIAISRR